MTDFWKSNPRKQCDFCKCWIADNKASIEFHEKGKNHQENVKRRLAEVKKKAAEKRKADESFSREFAAMEAAALKAVQKDLMSDPGIVGTSDLKVLVKDSNTVQNSATVKSKTEKNTIWTTCQAPQGFTYYYNQKTGESQWEKPAELSTDNKETKKKESGTKKSIDKKVEKSVPKKETTIGEATEQRRNHPLLGGWTTVADSSEESSHQQEGKKDEETEATVNEESLERTDIEGASSTNPEVHSSESRKRTAIFKEKQVKSLGNTSLEESVGFKKRKIKNNRNARKRDSDEE